MGRLGLLVDVHWSFCGRERKTRGELFVGIGTRGFLVGFEVRSCGILRLDLFAAARRR
jgi:hypothetical protein